MPKLRNQSTDMTTGNITRHLIFFAAPLLLGHIFQQLYNAVDSVVVGNYVGKEALAAVGSVGPIINILIGFFAGLSLGAGVVISQYYGAHNDRSVHDAVQTTVLMVLLLGIAFTVIGVSFTPMMLRFMKTPEDVFQESAEYLRIYFLGVSGLMLYNMGSGILRAVGDSKRPLYYLVVSAVINTVLDLLFVAVFEWGIAGAAYATIIAQGFSAVLVLITLTRTNGNYRIVWRKLHLDPLMLKKIFRIGMPTAIQSSITAFSNVFVQSYINRFGSACMAGWTAYNKIDAFAVLPMQVISMAVTTFSGQNIGAGNMERAKEGTKKAMVIGYISTAVPLAVVMIFARQFISLFNREEEVLYYGSLFILMISPFLLVSVINHVLSGAMRGAGETKIPTVIMISSFVVFRQIYLAVASALTDSVYVVALGYPMGWMLCSTLMFFYYRSGKWKKRIDVISPANEVKE